MKTKKSVGLTVLALAFMAQGVIGYNQIPGWKKNYAPKNLELQQGLSPDQLLLALSGFREMIAGILWVRADAFFDQGNYDAILPIIRLVTWLDPKQVDVYATGMWHIGYNFTDEESRSDRRYLPSAVALGKEGAKNNPETYELSYETGWLFYHKINDDYSNAVVWLEKAIKVKDIIPARRNLLGMAYQRDGQLEKALSYYYDVLDQANDALVKPSESAWGNHSTRDTIENMIDVMVVRMGQRGVLGARKGNSEVVEFDTNPQFDVGFSAQVTVVNPRTLRIKGTWNVKPIGTRIRVVLRDANYPGAIAAALDWDGQSSVTLDPPKDLTFMQDELYIRNRRADKTIDMSRDPTMYPFVADNYILEFYYNPRSAPPHIQDKFSWSGEGMTDPNFLNTEVRPGQRVIYTSMNLTRDQVLRRGAWIDQVPLLQTKNYVESGIRNIKDQVIQIPGLLSEPAPKAGAPDTSNSTDSLRTGQ